MSENTSNIIKNLQDQILKYEYVLRALSDIGEELCRVTTFEIQLKSLLHLLLGTLGVGKGGIFIYDSSISELTLKCSWKLSIREYKVTLDSHHISAISNLGDNIIISFSNFSLIPELAERFSKEDLNCVCILKVRERFIGLLFIGHKLKKTDFTEEELKFLATLSRNISVAINNFLLLNELRDINKRLDEKIQEVSILYQATQMIASELQLKSLLDMAMNATIEMSEVTRGSIWLFDDENNQLVLSSYLGNNANYPEHIKISESLIFKELSTNKEPIMKTSKFYTNVSENESDIKIFGNNYLIFPIVHQGEFLGIIHLSEKISQAEFTERDHRLLRVFALQLGVAIKNAKLYEQAITDGLTKLYLHRYFKQRIVDEFKRAMRFKRFLSLVMIDIDHFKKLNDTYGHQTGDEVLKRVASILRKTIRTHDLPVRYGGEEFALLLPETELTGAQSVAERIRKMIEAEIIEYDGKVIKITASFGVAEFPECANNPEELIKAADMALYYSKEHGRNRVSIAPKIYKSFENN